jgi:SAM-dependent methyltransferase
VTKRHDDPEFPDMEEGMTTAERRRRRRRGAGLRVPSDNVPRRSSQQPAVAPVPPVPEDPSIAVSIAYSFGGPSDGTPPPGTPVPVEPEPPAAAIAAPIEISHAGVPMTSAARAAAAATAADLDPLAEDVALYGKTREMPAMQLEALGLEVPEVTGAVERGGTGDTMVLDIEELQAEQEALEALQAEAEADPAGPEDGEAEARQLEEAVARAEQAGPADPEARPGAERAEPQKKARRAQTMALSEEDLEELMIRDPRERAAQPGAAAAATDRPADVEPVRPARTLEADLASFDEHSSPSLPAVRITTETEAAVPDGDDDDDGVPVDIDVDESAPGVLDAEAMAAIDGPAARAPSEPDADEVALDDADLQDELVPPGDASDSGEILSDELIEEVEAQTAQRVALRADSAEPEVSAPAPAPAPAPAKEPAAQAPADTSSPQAGKPPPAPAKPPPAPPKKASVARAAAVAAAVGPGQDAARDERRRRAKPWFEEIFDEDYLRTLPFLTPQATQAEAQFVIEALGLHAGAQVLDLGCGYGRHAMELAARGFNVVGLDLSLPLLLRGADEAQRRGLTINFVHGDMRELDFDAQFDGAYCVFSTFGFFDDETNKKTATNLARALKPGAKVVIDILNRDYLIADLPTRVWWEGDGCVILEEVDFNYFSSRIQCNRSVVFDDGRQVEQEISMRAYSLHEIGKLLHAAGFRVLEISGSMATRGRFFGGASRHIIVVAERKPKDPAKDTGALAAASDAPPRAG